MINNLNILGIDYGTKNIGIAICYKQTTFSVPYTTLNNDHNVFKNIKEIIEDEFIDIIVLGFPKTSNNYVSERHQLILNFKNELSNITKLKIVLVDESYTSFDNHDIQKKLGIKNSKIKKTKDQNAAKLIIDKYLNDN